MRPPPGESGGVVDGTRKMGTDTQCSAWLAAVESYSRRKLTNETDRLLALHELRKREEARLQAIHPAGDTGYAAGIFRITAPVGLLWAAVGTPIFPGEQRQTRILGRPSWSWTSFEGPVEYTITKVPLGTVRLEDNFEVVSWPEADIHGNVLATSRTSIVLSGVIKDMVIPETDIVRAAHGKEMACYDAKASSWIFSKGLRFKEEEELHKMGTIVFDEYTSNGYDYRDFNGKITKLSLLCICFAGFEEQVKIQKCGGGDRERMVMWHGPKGYAAFGLVVVPEDPDAVMEVADREDKEGRFSARRLFGRRDKSKGKEAEQLVSDSEPEKPLRCRRIGVFCGSPTSSRFFKGGKARVIELMD